MFQGLFRRAESTIDSVVSKYVGRAAIAIPLVIAGGFATAALTVKLVEIYGAVTAYAIMATLFALIGLVTMAVVNTGGRPAVESQTAEASAASEDATEGAGTDAADLLTPEVKAFLASAAPAALPSIVRGVGRNLPLILLLALIGFVISRFAETPEAVATPSEGDLAAAPPAA